MRTQGTVKRRSLLGSLSFAALTVVGCAAMLLPSALSGRNGAEQAPPYSLVDDAGGGSESPGSDEPSAGPSTHTPTNKPGNPFPGGSEKDTDEAPSGGSGGGIGEMSFGVQTALSLGLVAVFALLLIPGRRPPRSAGGRSGR